MVLNGGQYWVAIKLKFSNERTLVDLDKGTHYDKNQEIYQMERESFDYFTGQRRGKL